MTEDKWREYGFWLKQEREKTGVQQKDAAKKAEIHVVQLSRIENGRSGAKRETIIDVIEAINELSTGYKINLNDALNRAGFFGDNQADIIDDQFKDMALRFSGLPDDEKREVQPLIDLMDRELERLAKKEKQ